MISPVRALLMVTFTLFLSGADARAFGPTDASSPGAPRNAVKSVASGPRSWPEAAAALQAMQANEARGHEEEEQPERPDVSASQAADLCGSFAAGACSCM